MFEFYIYVTLVSVIMSVGGKLGTSVGDLFRVPMHMVVPRNFHLLL